jgi:hypothetical protein
MNVLELRRCAACGFQGWPRMQPLYKVTLAVGVLVFGAAILFLPWRRPGIDGSRASVMGAFFVAGLLLSRNAYRCRRCGGILY